MSTKPILIIYDKIKVDQILGNTDFCSYDKTKIRKWQLLDKDVYSFVYSKIPIFDSFGNNDIAHGKTLQILHLISSANICLWELGYI
jgi:hypothetical protein